jgi:hypothetical protein
MKKSIKAQGPGLKAYAARQKALKKSLQPTVRGPLPKFSMPVQSHPLPSTSERVKAVRAAVNW